MNQINDNNAISKHRLYCTIALLSFTVASVQNTPDLFSNTFADAGNKTVMVGLFARILLHVQLYLFDEGEREVAVAVLA